jgi:hypothetical protein
VFFLKRNALQADHARTFGLVRSLIIVIPWWPTSVFVVFGILVVKWEGIISKNSEAPVPTATKASKNQVCPTEKLRRGFVKGP